MEYTIQNTFSMTFAAPAGGVTAGVPIKIGDMIVVSLSSVAAGEKFTGYISGIFGLAAEGADSGQDYAVGDKVYWDTANLRVTKTATNNVALGFAAATKETAATTSTILLMQLG